MDIVHWDGHGGTTGAEMTSAAGDEVTITAAELFERTRNAFLYVVRACGATGKMPDGVSGAGATGTSSSLSIDLLDAGAPAVLGTHDSVLPTDLAYLPIIYPLLLQGLPLDYCAQYMRRFFSRRNADRRNGPFEPWYKLMLRTTSTWYLDAAPACTRAGSRRDPIAFVTALCRKFEQLQQAAGGDRERDEQKSLLLAPGEGGTAPEALDDVLKQLYDAELMD